MILTKTWQKVGDDALLGSHDGFNVYVRCYAKYSSQSIENNTSTVDVETRIYNEGGTFWSNVGTDAYAVIDRDETHTYPNGNYGAGETVVASKTKIVRHNENGTKTVSVFSWWTSEPWGWGNAVSGNVDLPTIDRYPLLITAPDFSDEDDPTITYTTTLGFEGATVEAGIFDSTGNTNYVPYRAVNVENGSYTFELTNEERTTLRNATPNSNTLNVMFKLRTTTTNNVEYFSTSVKQLRIVNANPTFTYTIIETNQKVIDLLGTSANTIIQNASIVRIITTPTTYKGTTMDAVMVTAEGFRDTDETPPYSVDVPVKSSNMRILVVDMRGNSAEELITKTLIEYQPVDITSFSFKRVNPTSSNILVSLEATYYQETFGSTANVPTVKWKLEDGSWNTIPSSAYTIDTTNNKLTITNYQLTDALVYTSNGQFYIAIEDLLTTDQESGGNGYVLKGIPTFDAGEHDFKVNGDLYVADQDGNNKANVLDKIEEASMETYSSTETIVGKWQDNKSIYRKYISGTTRNDNQALTILSGVSQLVNHEIIVNRSGAGQKHPLSSAMSGYDNSHAYPLFLDGTTLKLYITNSNYKNQSFYGWIEYTKNS